MKYKIIFTFPVLFWLIYSSFFLFSCSKSTIDHNYTYDYIYKNTSNHNVFIRYFKNNICVDSFHLANNRSYKQTLESDGSTSDLLIYSDSAWVLFDSVRYFMYKRQDSSVNNPVNLKKYKYLKISEYHEQYTFTFDSTNFNNAQLFK
jgi:hypothetical protein